MAKPGSRGYRILCDDQVYIMIDYDSDDYFVHVGELKRREKVMLMDSRPRNFEAKLQSGTHFQRQTHQHSPPIFY